MEILYTKNVNSGHHTSYGFTLVEILVVVVIIGLLATVILTSLVEARSKARDARRKGDIHNLITALEVYRNNNVTFPTPDLTSPDGPDWDLSSDGDFIPSLVPDYLAGPLLDPVNTAPLVYAYRNANYPPGCTNACWCPLGTNALVNFYLENGQGKDYTACGIDPNSFCICLR